MSDKKIKLKIVTPNEVKIDEFVDMVVIRCVDGAMGVLPGHMPLSTALDYGIARILNAGSERRIAIFGGIAEIKNDLLTVLTNEAEWPEDINVEEALLNRTAISQNLKMQKDSVEVQRSQVLLRRSLVEIEVSSYGLLGKPKKDERDRDKEKDQK